MRRVLCLLILAKEGLALLVIRARLVADYRRTWSALRVSAWREPWKNSCEVTGMDAEGLDQRIDLPRLEAAP